MSKKSIGTDTFVVQDVILSFPHLFALDNNGKFSSALLFTEAAAGNIYQQAQELAKRGIQEGIFPANADTLPNFRWPVMRASDKVNGEGQYTYRDIPRLANRWLGSCSAQPDRPPQVVDQNRQPLLDRGQIYAGCVVAVGIRLFTYNNKGNMGIGIGLNAVMKTGDGEALAGGAVNPDALFAGVQAQAPTPGQSMPGGAPAPAQAPATPFGQPTQAANPGMPAAPFGQPDKPSFM